MRIHALVLNDDGTSDSHILYLRADETQTALIFATARSLAKDGVDLVRVSIPKDYLKPELFSDAPPK